MAGRYIVIEFEDVKLAESWLKGQHRRLIDDDGEVIAEFVKPRVFCKCPDRTKQSAGNWVRSKKYGIFFCRACKRPSIFHERGVLSRLEWALGKNLLKG